MPGLLSLHYLPNQDCHAQALLVPAHRLCPHSPSQALLLGPCKGDQVSFRRTTYSSSLRMLTAPVTSKRSPWTNPMTSSVTVPPRASTLGRLGWAGIGGSGAQGSGQEPGSPLPLNVAPAAHLRSAGTLLPPCLSSTTMVPSLAAATRWEP